MSSTMDDVKKSKELEYIEKRNQEKLAKLAAGVDPVRRSPVTGEPMKQESILGVVVDRCPSSGGVWLDGGELEQLLERAKTSDGTDLKNWVSEFFASLAKR